MSRTRFHAPKIGHWIYYIIHVCIGDWDCVGGLWQLNVASVFWSQFGVSMCFPCVYNAKSLPNLGKLVLFSSLHLLEILFLLPKDDSTTPRPAPGAKHVCGRFPAFPARLTMCVVSQRAELGDVCVETLLKDRDSDDSGTIGPLDHPTFRRNERNVM